MGCYNLLDSQQADRGSVDKWNKLHYLIVEFAWSLTSLSGSFQALSILSGFHALGPMVLFDLSGIDGVSANESLQPATIAS
ncbi:MAG TPA: hypothetical protein PK951_08760 [Chitinophagaceae bacterium]|nr:hypothetical protein [Chitinophagaceae bacterium]